MTDAHLGGFCVGLVIAICGVLIMALKPTQSVGLHQEESLKLQQKEPLLGKRSDVQFAKGAEDTAVQNNNCCGCTIL